MSQCPSATERAAAFLLGENCTSIFTCCFAEMIDNISLSCCYAYVDDRTAKCCSRPWSWQIIFTFLAVLLMLLVLTCVGIYIVKKVWTKVDVVPDEIVIHQDFDISMDEEGSQDNNHEE